MMKFKMSGNMLRFANFKAEIVIEAGTLDEGIQKLVADHPQLRPVLLDGDGRFRAVHRVFLNGELIAKDALQHPVGAGDEVSILTAIAGG
jgi:molybdopterin converting factor small subunit